jgi:hypothetical protein
MDEKSGSGLTASRKPSGPTSEELSVIGDRAMALEVCRRTSALNKEVGAYRESRSDVIVASGGP